MKRPEEALQRAVVDMLNLTQPDCAWWHCPNGGGRSKAEAGIFKAMGVKAGVFDLHFCLKGGQFATIELKVEGESLSQAQIAWQSSIYWCKGLTEFCTSVDGVMAVLKSWGVTFKRRAA